jgi:predicted membrane chloride channel (bestrophin family)
MRKNEMHNALTIFEDTLGSSERLLTSPVPLFYQRHVARFLSIWLLLLPFALYDPFASTWNHIAMIPATAVMSVFLFGIEELATQMEEPFTILPMQAFCDKIGNWCNEIVTWEDGDNGIRTRASYQGHSSVYFENFAEEPNGESSGETSGLGETDSSTVRSRLRKYFK